MPNKFRAKSEYRKHFKWFSLSKLASVQAAGADPNSCQSDFQFEPIFQSRKKRQEGPTECLSNEDYILLGKNDKFNLNVKYKYKRRPVTAVDERQDNSEDNQTEKSPPEHSPEKVNEYILLGNQSKFSNNIVYKPKTCPEVNDKNKENSSANSENKPTPTRCLPENSQKAASEYFLLGSHNKFANNIVYKPKKCPEVVIVNDKNKENSSNDDYDKESKTKEIREEPSNLDDEYILLGSNAKFSDNIVYKPKTWQEFIPRHDEEKENKPAEDTEDFPVQAKKLEPAPVIDTSKFCEPPKTLKKPVEKTDDSVIKIKEKKTSSAIQEGAREELRLPLDDLPSRREAPDKERKNAFKKEKRGGASNGQDLSPEKSVTFQSPPQAPRSPKKSNSQQKFDQRLLALLHKARVHQPRATGEQSEYQNNFTWKKPFPKYGTAAENKKLFQTTTIFQTDVSHQDPHPKQSEYQRNFQSWLPTKPASRPSNADAETVSSLLRGHPVNNTDQDKESIEDQPDISSVASGISSDENADNIKQENNIKRTKSLEFLHNPTAKNKPSKPRESQYSSLFKSSEYRDNFKAPSKYDYMKNPWNTTTSCSNEDMLDLLSDGSGKGDWYSEVLDLRRKAAEYRRRAQNTHFCADHMAQLLADENRLWEHASSDRPTSTKVDVRNMRPAGICYKKHYLQSPMFAQREPYDYDPEPQMTLEDVTDDADVDSVHSESETDANCVPTSSETDANCVPTSSETDVVPEESLEEINGGVSQQTIEDARELLESPVGRIPTPDLEEQNMMRHHLDRTTPSKGFLLTSPPKNTKQIDSENVNTSNTAANVDTIESHHYSASDVEVKPKHCVKTCALPSKSNCMPTFGNPSKDTHVLRPHEHLSGSTKPLPKASPQILSRDTSNVTMRSGNKRHPAGININQPIPESYLVPAGRVYATEHKPNEKPHLDEDYLSHSLESNSSLASETLARTRKRLDFW